LKVIGDDACEKVVIFFSHSLRRGSIGFTANASSSVRAPACSPQTD
jgi:hypothetical protein